MDNFGDTPTLDLGCIPEHDTTDRPVNIAYALDQMMRSLLPSQNTAFFESPQHDNRYQLIGTLSRSRAILLTSPRSSLQHRFGAIDSGSISYVAMDSAVAVPGGFEIQHLWKVPGGFARTVDYITWGPIENLEGFKTKYEPVCHRKVTLLDEQERDRLLEPMMAVIVLNGEKGFHVCPTSVLHPSQMGYDKELKAGKAMASKRLSGSVYSHWAPPKPEDPQPENKFHPDESEVTLTAVEDETGGESGPKLVKEV